MSGLDFYLPLRIEVGEESVRVLDRADRTLVYVYVCSEPDRRKEMKRLSPEEGGEVAEIAMRALTERLSGA